MKVKRFDFYFNPNDAESVPTFDEVENGKYILYSDHIHSVNEVLRSLFEARKEADEWKALAEESIKLANDAINK